MRRLVLSFLHTAATHVPTFTRIAREFDPGVPIRHSVRDDLFAQALSDGGITEATRLGTQSEVLRLIDEGAKVVLCTCSTLGSAAEETPHSSPARVLRIDRPLVEHAVSLGRPLFVVAATPTAMATTLALLQSAAETTPLRCRTLLCDRAWMLFQAGDHAGYTALIAEQVETGARQGEVIVLAQASMEPAAAMIARRDVDVLTSPRLAVRTALSLL